jgi:glycosyltransferase involved in cell wall biosynthesis
MEKHGVLFLTNSLPVGGFETHLLSLLQAIDKERFRPVVGCLKGGGPLEPEFRAAGIPVYSHLQRGRMDLGGVLRVASIMRREKIRVLDTDAQRNTMLIGTLAAILMRVPVRIASVHATARAGKSKIFVPASRFCLRWTDRVVALADCHRDLILSQEEGLDPHKVTVLWNGVDTTKFYPGTPPAGLAESLGIHPGTPVIMIVASLLPDKGHKVFLEAAALVLQEQEDAVFLVAGEGPEREGLETTASRMGIGESVRFLGRRRDLHELLHLTDINALTSYPFRETFPISVLEAMACGKPTVATRVGALPDMIMEGETGFIREVGDAEGIAKAITQLLDDRESLLRMGNAARQRVEKMFSISRTAARREDLYTQLLDRTDHRG